MGEKRFRRRDPAEVRETLGFPDWIAYDPQDDVWRGGYLVPGEWVDQQGGRPMRERLVELDWMGDAWQLRLYAQFEETTVTDADVRAFIANDLKRVEPAEKRPLPVPPGRVSVSLVLSEPGTKRRYDWSDNWLPAGDLKKVLEAMADMFLSGNGKGEDDDD